MARSPSALLIPLPGLTGGRTLFDLSQNQNNGSLLGGVSWTSDLYDYGLKFDGSTGYVQMPNVSLFNFVQQNFTWIARFNAQSLSNGSFGGGQGFTLLEKIEAEGTSQNVGYSWSIQGNSGNNRQWFWNTSGQDVFGTSNTFSTNKIYEVAVTFAYTGTGSNNLQFYTNGQLDGSLQHVPNIVLNSTTLNAKIGHESWTGGFSQGTLEFFAIFPYVLTPGQVLQFYQESQAGFPTLLNRKPRRKFISLVPQTITAQNLNILTFNNVGSGGAKGGGAAIVMVDYNVVGSSGAKGGSAAIIMADYNVTGSGGAKGGTAGIISCRYNVTGSSGAKGGSSATVQADYSITGSGGAKGGGAARALATYNITGSGGTRGGSAAIENAIYNITGISGATCNGTASSDLEDDILGTGGVLGGDGAVYGVVYSITGTGGASANGSAITKFSYMVVGSGGVVATSSAIVNATYTVIGTDGSKINGSAVVDATYNIVANKGGICGDSGITEGIYNVTGSSGSLAGGTALVVEIDRETISGGVLDGGTDITQATYNPAVSGGLIGESLAVIEATYNVSSAVEGLAGGSAPNAATYDETFTGGAKWGGEGSMLTIFIPGAGGGVLCAGSAVGFDYNEVASGGAIGGGNDDVDTDVAFFVYNLEGMGGATIDTEAVIGDDYFNPLRNLYIRFTTGDRAYIRTRWRGPLSNFKNRPTTVRGFVLLETTTKYFTDLGEFYDEELLSTAEQQNALENDQANYQQQIERLIGV